MDRVHVVGIDPGLVHTGLVRLLFKGSDLEIDTLVVDKDDPRMRDWVHLLGLPRPHIFIEGYRPRHNFGTNPEMLGLVKDLHARFYNSVVLDNTGVTKVVTQSLLTEMGLWKFSTTTHHQDLRSAARIAVLGMMKNKELNKVLTDWLMHHLREEST